MNKNTQRQNHTTQTGIWTATTGGLMDENGSPVLEELRPRSKRLYLIFGGINASMGIPPFEFYESARLLDHNKIFFRDFKQAWYQCGLPGIASDIYALGDYIQSRIEQLAPEEVVFVGNSMGGFAAILFASMLGGGHAIVFSAQTFISPRHRVAARDFRWARQVLKTYASSVFRPHIYDLSTAIGTRVPFPLQIDLHFSRLDRLDVGHAEALARQPAVRLHAHEIGGHMLVRHLRDTGDLADILLASGQCS